MRSTALFIVGLLILALGIATAGVDRQTRDLSQLCNGYAELCNRKLSNVTFLGAHNSYAVKNDSRGLTLRLSSNQYLNVSRQLSDGIRMLQGQGHRRRRLPIDGQGKVELCHTDCALLDGGTLTHYLQKVKDFLDYNPNEVIILLWVNGGGEPIVPVADWAESYHTTGLDQMSYSPTNQPLLYDEWPTLAELIANNTRVITFMDVGANTSIVSYILDEFSQIWETIPDPLDESFPCTQRSDHYNNRTDIMYLINHNLNKQLSPNQTNILGTITVPYTEKINTTNAATGNGSIGFAVDRCLPIFARNPTIVLVDFYNYPVVNGVLQAQANLNGLTLH